MISRQLIERIGRLPPDAELIGPHGLPIAVLVHKVRPERVNLSVAHGYDLPGQRRQGRPKGRRGKSGRKPGRVPPASMAAPKTSMDPVGARLPAARPPTRPAGPRGEFSHKKGSSDRRPSDVFYGLFEAI